MISFDSAGKIHETSGLARMSNDPGKTGNTTPPTLSPDSPRQMQRLALKVMRAFAVFRPRLVGWLANDVEVRHAPVQLLLHADTAEFVIIEMMEQGIHYREAEHRLYFSDGSQYAAPSFHFMAGEQAIELIVTDERHQRKGAPVDPRSRKTKPGLSLKALETTLKS